MFGGAQVPVQVGRATHSPSPINHMETERLHLMVLILRPLMSALLRKLQQTSRVFRHYFLPRNWYLA